MFCLNKNLVNEFLNRIKTGDLNPEKLADMTTEERRSYFSSFLGDLNAEKVNTLFESKLLLKNQQQGILNWAKSVADLKPQARRDIISRINKMDKVLNPETQDAFLADIASHKLGVTVTMEEAGQISSLAKDVSLKRDAIKENSPPQSEERMAYGRAKAQFDDYINGLKENESNKKLSEYLKPENYLEGASKVAGLAKSMKASLDNSVIGRQGLKVLFSHPEIWLKNSKQSFIDIARTFGGHDVMTEVRADVMSRPNALNGLYKKEGLAVGVREEAYPTNLPERLPVLGKAFKASETAFTAFQYRTRADIFDKYAEIYKDSGADLEGFGKIANSLTGRGKLGALEPVGNIINNVFFSPRLLKSHIDTLTAHAFDKNISKAARKEAATNLVKIIGGVAGILSIAYAVNPDSVENDPRSSDFGKIKDGATRFDVSGGMASVVTLASRLTTLSTKSSMTGKVKSLTSGKFGQPTGTDVLYSFIENKLSPAASIVKDLLKGEDFQHNKPTLVNEASNLLMPLPITNYKELKDNPDSANKLLVIIADALGISANTYTNKKSTKF